MKIDFSPEQRDAFSKLGQESARKRFKGLSDEEISTYMSRVRAERTKKQKLLIKESRNK